jgi:hypothetical protein
MRQSIYNMGGTFLGNHFIRKKNIKKNIKYMKVPCATTYLTVCPGPGGGIRS